MIDADEDDWLSMTGKREEEKESEGKSLLFLLIQIIKENDQICHMDTFLYSTGSRKMIKWKKHISHNKGIGTNKC